MPKTKAQKKQVVEESLGIVQKSQAVVFADFTGISVNDLNTFRRAARAIGALYTVIKKRLLKIIFEKEGLSFDPKSFEGQTGVIFSPKDLVETSALAYKFAVKQKDAFKILGGFDLVEKKFVDAASVKRFGQLPSREALLGQLVGMLSVPIRSFLFVLNEKAKRSHEISK